MAPILFRLDPAAPGDISQPKPLKTSLALHLAHAPLTTVLARIGDTTRAYLSLVGCAGCFAGRCHPGCRADLLSRALHAAGIAQPALIPGGLACRPFTRATLARPGAAAQPLDETLLAPWPDARLIVHWQDARTVAALLATSGDGPTPTTVLRRAGWLPVPLATRLPLAWARRPMPPTLPFPGRWQGEPFLFLPRRSPAPHAAPIEPAPSHVDMLLAGWLRQVIDSPTAALHAVRADSSGAPAPSIVGDIAWPGGPNGMPAATLADLLPRLLVEPAFESSRAGQSGISKGRLASLRHHALNDATARALMVWFDRAGILMPPEQGQGPWRAPRRFATQDLDAIAARLRATPLPQPDDVRAAYGADQ